MPVVLGVDSSTQSTKVEARDLTSGEILASASARHPATSPPRSEQDPASWWAALREAVQALGDIRRQVVAMSVAGQQHGLVLIDEAGNPVRPAKLWNDTESAPQAERLVAAWGAEAWADATGTVPVPAITITKLAWVADQEPEALARAAKVMLPHDYLTWRLTGRHVTDRGDASGTGWFDPVENRYLPDLIARAVGDAEFSAELPLVLGPEQAAGTLLPEVAEDLGLPPAVLVGPGSGDNMSAALGLGLRSGDATISLGTSGTAFAVSATPTRDPSAAVAGFASADGAFLPLVCTLNATKVTDTVARWFGLGPAELAELALGAAAEPGTVTVIPWFDGERTPNVPDATGTMFGVTNATTRQQIALAAHDGVLCGLLDGVDALSAVGASVDGRLFLVGGGARSVAYRQRLADLSGRSIVVPHTDETVATGAAAQAAVVASADNLETVAQRWNLGAGDSVAPEHDGSDVRERYDRMTEGAVSSSP